MVKGVIYLFISQIVSLITNFGLHIYLGRTLGPALYGIFGVINSFIIVNEYMLFKGVYETISKFVAERQETTNAIISRSVKVLLVVSPMLGAIYFLFARDIASLMNDPELAKYIKLFAFIIPIVALSTVFLGALNGLKLFGRQALISILFNIVRLISVFVLVFSGFAVKGVVIGLIIADLFRLIMSRVLCRPTETNSGFDSKKMFRFALQLISIALITSVVMNIDLLAVKVLLKDNFQTGLYTSAVTVSKFGRFLMYPVSLVVLPTISKSIATGDMILTEQYIKKSMRILLIFVLPLSLIIIATSKSFMTFFYGDRYIYASGILKILMLGTIFLSMKVVVYNIIVAGGWPRYIIFLSLLSLLVDIVFLIILIDKIGLMGAAVASTITHFLGFLLSYGYVARRFMTKIIPFFLVRIVSASLIVYFIATIFSPSGITLIVYYISLLCFFLLLLIMMQEINLAEVKLKLKTEFENYRQNKNLTKHFK